MFPQDYSNIYKRKGMHYRQMYLEWHVYIENNFFSHSVIRQNCTAKLLSF